MCVSFHRYGDDPGISDRQTANIFPYCSSGVTYRGSAIWNFAIDVYVFCYREFCWARQIEGLSDLRTSDITLILRNRYRR